MKQHLSMQSRSSLHSSRYASGFSLVEVLVVAGILAVLAAAGTTILRTSWQNERVTAVANEFATWLEQVKTTSMRNDSQVTVCITPNGDDSGEVLATATPTTGTNPTCPLTNPVDTFLIPEMPAGRFTIAMINSSATLFNYTPRGSSDNPTPIEVSFAARDQTALRCVQVSATLGQIRVGRMNGNACITT
jgi:prepilin-type N-terminal cleavage/methylation domain-containing protein